jgi:hypothetical protein
MGGKTWAENGDKKMKTLTPFFCHSFFRRQIESGVGRETPELPESRWDFILHDADGEVLMPRDCPAPDNSNRKGYKKVTIG